MAARQSPDVPEGWFDWAYKGVDPSFPGNGGLECRDFLSVSQRCWESIVASLVALLALLLAYPRLRLPRNCPYTYRSKPEPLGKRVLLILMCLTFGIELGFKFATRQMIWIGNPCHLASMMQIFILAAPPSRIVTSAFRLHMHMLTGAPIAILFPVINTRLLPFETEVYFLQHFLMLIIPFYLMNTGDPFIPEKLSDFNWAMVSFGFLFIYHFLPLQLLAYLSQVNLNNMLCPAVSDPFHGKYYRLFAICHQVVLIPTLGKLFVVLARAFNILPCDNPVDEAPAQQVFKCESSLRCCHIDNTCSSSNPSTQSSAASQDCDDSGFLGAAAESKEEDISAGSDIGGSGGGSLPCCCHPSNSSREGTTMVTRRIVNGHVVPDCEGNGEGTGECCCEARRTHQSNAVGQSREQQQKSHRPENGLTMSDLQSSRNSHAKSH